MVTKERFLRNPRAAELRRICLTMADSTQRLLHDIAVNEQAEYTLLDQAQNTLLKMGITARMSIGLSESAYKDPVTLCQWLAGQWLDAFSKKYTPKKPLIIEQLREKPMGDISINAEDIPPMLISFEVMRSLIDTTYRVLDAEKGE